ncbi:MULTISPECIES: Imm26 family immunity protein [unclassified Pseudomonas]|uniref:Imm26 family immunity protein n=1 Tax=unclassified Pseudomonas TaxID=196821 RepID=UPI000863785A|nr:MULTISPECIES: Imm26 family immunity protein [unclassified Pseudomonas]MDH1696933.1 immunity 26/phosphotriesterase HocA family protein [Pseudomonas sp. GD03766]UFH24713.1 immunity 26/phosphotriesterase HocA family protein [Pseudomonas sp. CIP-10]HDS1061966.1 phosphotriesterase [Pseudomonas putida]
MTSLEVYEWDKKIKTSYKKIKSGDIFCFALDSKKYGVGRIITQNSLGHVVEIFDKVLNVPAVDSLSFKRLGDPVILDSYSLFDRKAEGDWRIVAHDLDYRPSKQESVRYVYGVADNVKLVDIFDNESSLAGSKCDYPSYSPMGDKDVKEHFNI